MTEVAQFDLHLTSGKSLVVGIEVPEDADESEILEDLRLSFGAQGSRWIVVGDALIFTGAVSAIQPR